MSGRQGGRLAEVDMALVFAVDSSGSVSNERMNMYIEGHADAVTSPRFLAGVANLPTGRVALAYVAWSNFDRQQYLVPWQVVDGPQSAAVWARTLRDAVRPNAGFTSISGVIDFCHDHLLRLAPPATRRVIDLIADGRNNDGRPVTAARDAAVAAGIVINGLPVLDNEPTLDSYFADEVVGGTACFVLPVQNEASLLDAIRRKLLAEIALTMAAPLLRLAVGIVTTGRAAVLGETLAELRRQTRPPDRLVVCGAEPADLAGIAPGTAKLILAPRGMTLQRNAVLDTATDCDVLVFFDDDFLPAPSWLAEIEAAFAADPAIVAATGHVIADGANGPGLSPATGRALLATDRAPTGPMVPVYNAYGCNMALRLAILRAHALRFDAALPLYAWYEDIDLCRRAASHGRIVRVPAARGVHLGTKIGRTSGVRFGYSQIVNPVYLARKGSYGWARALRSMARYLAINLVRAAAPEPWIDRSGRLRGNLLALADLARGRVDPGRILAL